VVALPGGGIFLSGEQNTSCSAMVALPEARG